MLINKNNNSTLLYIFLIIHFSIWTLIPTFVYENLPLDTIEALVWGNGIEWGNNKHPPLSIFFTELIYSIFKTNNFAYYLLCQTFILINFIYIYKLSKFFFDEKRTQIFIVFLTSLIFYYSLSSTEFNVNICILPFWTSAIYYTFKSVEKNKNKDWALLGLVCALGFLSKYIIAYLFFGIIVFLIFIFAKEKKINLKIFISLFVFIVIISPHILWLIENNFETIKYAFGRVSAYSKFYQSLIFFLKQLIFFFILFLFHFIFFKFSFNSKNLFSKKSIFLICIFVVPFVLILITSIITGSKIRTAWLMPFYSISCLAITYYFFDLKNKKLFILFIFLYLLNPVIFLGSFYSDYTKNRTKDAREKRVLYEGKRISEIAQQEWNKISNKKIMYVIGDEWYGGNLSYHLKDRPYLYIHKDMEFWYANKDIKSLSEIMNYGVILIEKDLHEINASFMQYNDKNLFYLKDEKNKIKFFNCKLEKKRLENDKLNIFVVYPGCK